MYFAGLEPTIPAIQRLQQQVPPQNFLPYSISIYVPQIHVTCTSGSVHLLIAVTNCHCFLQQRPTHPHHLPLRKDEKMKVKHKRNNTVSNTLLQLNRSKMGNAVMKGTARLPFLAVVRPAI